MTDFKLKENSGTIFKNNFKEAGDNKPDYRGTINVDGKEKEISLWVKEGAKGKYFSASIKEPYKKRETPQNEPKETNDLPF